MRATLMVAGTLLDRGYAIWNALAATAIVILIIAPPTLADSSFQFTFLAALGILLLVGPSGPIDGRMDPNRNTASQQN